MTDDIKAIRDALAAGPTPGPWKHKRHADVMVGTLRLCHVNAAAKLGMGDAMHRCDVNAAYIAACHPERIARLLDALEAATRDAERWRRLRNDPPSNWYVGPVIEVDEVGGTHGYFNHWGADLDAAIDAAMAQSPEAVG